MDPARTTSKEPVVFERIAEDWYYLDHTGKRHLITGCTFLANGDKALFYFNDATTGKQCLVKGTRKFEENRKKLVGPVNSDVMVLDVEPPTDTEGDRLVIELPRDGEYLGTFPQVINSLAVTQAESRVKRTVPFLNKWLSSLLVGA